MSHATHPTAHTAHPMHALEPRVGRTKARTVVDSLHRIHLAGVALAHVATTHAMDLLVVNVCGMLHPLAGVARVAHNFPQVQPVIVRNLTPTLATLVHCDYVIETFARCSSQQVCLL